MTKTNLSLEHVLKPSSRTAGKSPVIIMLHGYGSHENDLFSFAAELPDDYVIVSAKAPIPVPPYGNAWYNISLDPDGEKFTNDDQAVKSRDLIAQFIDEVIDHYHADADNVTLFGFSQGAILSYAVSLSYPEKVHQVVAMSGYIHKELLREGFEKNDFSRLRVYSSHGSVDQVVPVAWDRKTQPFLQALKIDSTYSEFPIGHGVNPDNFNDIRAWLNA